MEIIITKSFKKEFLKLLKYETFIDDFVKQLQSKNHTFIKFKDPYKKFKYKIGNISLRSILFFTVNEKIIPIYIAKKSDKKKGYNIFLDSRFENILEKKLKLMREDIKNEDFESYF